MLVDCRSGTAQEQSLKGMGPGRWHQTGNRTTVAGDLDLLAGGSLVEEAQEPSLGGGGGHGFSHMAIIMVILSAEWMAVTSSQGPSGFKFSPRIAENLVKSDEG